jgi:hypothetical protein
MIKGTIIQKREILLGLSMFIFLIGRETHCSFINFNEYVDVFPTSYSVEIYFDQIVSENLGFSKVPVALVDYNSSKPDSDYYILNCRFRRIQHSLKNARYRGVIKFVAISVLDCIFARKYQGCGVLNVVSGQLCSSVHYCSLTNENNAMTIFLVDSEEKNFIINNPGQTLHNLYSELVPHFILVFDSKKIGLAKSICSFKLNVNRVSCHCSRTAAVSEAVFSDILNSRTEWYTGDTHVYSLGRESDTSSAWNYYFDHDVQRLLTTEILKRANETGNHTKMYGRGLMGQYLRWYEISLFTQHTLLETTRLKFVSCFVKEQLPFKSYVKSFHKEVWISIVSVCMLISITVFVLNRYYKLSKSFSPFFFFISTLLEEPFSVPSAVWNNRIFKTLTISWILTAMVFTNLYIGLMISDVTAPLQGEKVKSFNKVLRADGNDFKNMANQSGQLIRFWLRNFTDYSGKKWPIQKLRPACDFSSRSLSRFQYFDSRGYELHHSRFHDKKGFALLQKPLETCPEKNLSTAVQKKFFSYPWMYNEIGLLEQELLTSRVSGAEKAYVMRLKTFFLPRNRYHPKHPKFLSTNDNAIPYYLSAAVEEELIACGKSIYIGESKDLERELLYLRSNYPRKGFYMSNDTFETKGSRPVIWMFRNSARSKAPHYFKLLIEGGIRDGILSLRSHKYYAMRSIGTKLIKEAESKMNKSSGMAGSIQTIFLILLYILSFATLVFLAEIIIKNCLASAFLQTCKAVTQFICILFEIN